MTTTATAIDRAAIGHAHDRIRDHVRLTPILSASGADLGLAPFPLTLKLELFQHAGSFKTRGAFTNLLSRTIPKGSRIRFAVSDGGSGVDPGTASSRYSCSSSFPNTISSSETTR